MQSFPVTTTQEAKWAASLIKGQRVFQARREKVTLLSELATGNATVSPLNTI